ncbi:MAG: DNA-binding response regulator [Acidobacteria bacterium]|nr:MAG: DNA-binding response regulator [Acidobacteriota bacterium]
MKPKPITVLVVDDHTVVRRGIVALLSTEAGIQVVGEAANGTEAIERAHALTPQVILMDLVMPGMDGVEATAQIIARNPDAQVLVLTSFGSDAKLFPAVRAGAVGYLLKDTSPEELVKAIRRTAAGESPLNPSVARRLLRELAHEERPGPRAEALSQRETEVLRLLARGLGNEEIGTQLFISEATVRTHVSSILSKLGVSNRTQAALYALREGLATIE